MVLGLVNLVGKNNKLVSELLKIFQNRKMIMKVSFEWPEMIQKEFERNDVVVVIREDHGSYHTYKDLMEATPETKDVQVVNWSNFWFRRSKRRFIESLAPNQRLLIITKDWKKVRPLIAALGTYSIGMFDYNMTWDRPY